MNELIYRATADKVLAAADKVNEAFEDLFDVITDAYGEESKRAGKALDAHTSFLEFVAPLIGESELEALSEARVAARKGK